MFWIYGGGFATGNSDNKLYDGQHLAENQDVVVVSFKYVVQLLLNRGELITPEAIV